VLLQGTGKWLKDTRKLGSMTGRFPWWASRKSRFIRP